MGAVARRHTPTGVGPGLILICPACSKRYLVPSSSLGADGRRVRCAACGNSWFQEPPPQETEASPLNFDDPVFDPPPEDVEPPPLRAGSNLPALRRKPVKKRKPIGWIVLILVVGVLLGGGILGRASIVGLWPPAARLYEAVGLPVPVPGAGLLLHDVATERMTQGGVPVIVVTGSVVNPTGEIRDVPKLRASLRDSQRKEVQSWTFSADTDKLVPGEFVKFGSEFANPSAEAVDLTLTFTN
jgi:predicted Zn finger-like uncharacterized protein